MASRGHRAYQAKRPRISEALIHEGDLLEGHLHPTAKKAFPIRFAVAGETSVRRNVSCGWGTLFQSRRSATPVLSTATLKAMMWTLLCHMSYE